MITFAVISLTAMLVAGISVVLYALNHAVDGYEDERGFHHGIAPIEAGIVSTSICETPATSLRSCWQGGNFSDVESRAASARTAGVW